MSAPLAEVSATDNTKGTIDTMSREDLEETRASIEEKAGVPIRVLEFTAGSRPITAFIATTEGRRAIIELEPDIMAFFIRPGHETADTAFLTKRAIEIL